MSGIGRKAFPDVQMCREALPNVLEWSRVPSGCSGVVRSPFWMSRSVRESLLDIWACSEGPPRCLGLLGRLTLMSRRPTRMSGSSREALTYVREWSRCILVCQGVVRRPSRMSGSGQEALPDVR